ncbi:MAG: glycosyltransferase [Rhodospirillales bacterium]|nr:glycosyltransferase [Rhodospirillales bacterium]
MRVLNAMAGAHHGGAEAFFERLSIGLASAGVEQKVIIRKDADRADRLRAGGGEVTQLPFGGLLDFCTPFALRKICRTYRPDVVMTWMNRATRMMPTGDYSFVARLGGYYDLKYYRRCDHLIGNTRDIVDYLIRQGWPADRAHYVPNFVSADTAPPVSRAAHSTPDDVPLLLSLGRLHKNKAFDVLLAALPKIPNAVLWIAGDGPERDALQVQAQKRGVLDRIRFLGWRQDVAALMATCDVYVCPSRHEPLGNVVIEAWAASRPVVAAASQGPLALIENGVSGLLAAVDSADEMATQINQVLNNRDLAGELAVNGYGEYESKFTEQIVVAQYLDFFNRIVEAR